MTWTTVDQSNDDMKAIKNTEPKNAKLVSAEPILTRMSDVTPTDVRWLWSGRIPLGKLTVLDGDPGLGKSMITMDLAARVSRGLEMPDGSRGDLEGPAGVVILSAEDDPSDTIRPRLDAAGGDPSRVVLMSGVKTEKRERMATLADVAEIRKSVEAVQAKLIIVDPIMAYLGGSDSHVDAEIRSLLAPLAQLAAELGVAILLVRHLNKAQGGNPIYRGGGSIGIIGAARTGLLVAAEPEDESGLRRVLAVTKSNLAKKAAALSYLIEPTGSVAKVTWMGESHHTASTLLTDGEQDSAFGEAKQFLQDALTSVPRRVPELQREAKQAGISWRTIERAKKALNAKKVKEGFGSGSKWLWSLPAQADGGLNGLREEGDKNAKSSDSCEDRQVAAFENKGVLLNTAKTAKLEGDGGEPCYACKGRQRWRRKEGGPDRCVTCHPPPSGVDVEPV